MSTERWIHDNEEKCKKYRRDWYIRNKASEIAKAKQRNKENRQAVREWFKQVKASLICSVCKEDHPACLQFHHTDPTTKVAEVSRMIGEGYSRDTIETEISKCEVLCANCHAKKHWDHLYEGQWLNGKSSVTPNP